MTLGEKIKLLRKESKMTQQELADKTKIERSSISKYEKNIVTPSAPKLNEIANALNVSVSYFLEDDTETKKVDSTDEGKTFPKVLFTPGNTSAAELGENQRLITIEKNGHKHYFTLETNASDKELEEGLKMFASFLANRNKDDE